MFTMTTNDESAKTAPRAKHPGGPERTCAGCGKHAEADELVRVVHDPGSGEIAVDLASKAAGGRGAHVHPSPDCLAKALKSGFARVFKAQVTANAAALGEDIVKAA